MINFGAVLGISFVVVFLLFWLWLVLGVAIARPIYKRHYYKTHRHYPRRSDVPRWIWILLGLRMKRGRSTSHYTLPFGDGGDG